MLKKISNISFVIMCFMFVIVTHNCVLAADISVSPSSITMYVGETKTITINGSGVCRKH